MEEERRWVELGSCRRVGHVRQGSEPPGVSLEYGEEREREREP